MKVARTVWSGGKFRGFTRELPITIGYRDPNMPNVPSIMMTKRHAIEEFTPLICKIKIKNNIGRVPSTPGY